MRRAELRGRRLIQINARKLAASEAGYVIQKQAIIARCGSFLTESGCPRHVRFTPGSDC
jgi:hypothetical protein